MPQLARLSDPHYLASLATDLDPALREAAVPLVDGPLQVTPVRYRPGQPPSSPRQGVTGDTGSSRLLRQDRQGHLRRTGDRGGYPPRPAAGEAVPTRDRGRAHGLLRAGLRRAVADGAGAPLSRLLAVRAGEAAAYVALVGRAARVLHDEACAAMGPPSSTACPTTTSPPRSARPCARGARPRTAPRGRSAVRRRGRRRGPRAGGVEGHAACFLHGDLKSDNLLVDDGRVRVLDLDRVCLGDAALDLGKLLADLRWCAGSEPRAQRLQAALRDGYGPDTDDRWARPVYSPPCSR